MEAEEPGNISERCQSLREEENEAGMFVRVRIRQKKDVPADLRPRGDVKWECRLGA